ncbi:MAG: RidA family protein, partial [Pseudomonadota bacterium]
MFTSGQVPFVRGELLHKGKVGGELTVEEGYECARITI